MCALLQPIDIGVQDENVDPAVPNDAIIAEGPVEGDFIGAGDGETQPLDVVFRRERTYAVDRLLQKRLSHYHHPPNWPCIQPCVGEDDRGALKKQKLLSDGSALHPPARSLR